MIIMNDEQARRGIEYAMMHLKDARECMKVGDDMLASMHITQASGYLTILDDELIARLGYILEH